MWPFGGHGGSETEESNWWSGYKVRPSVPRSGGSQPPSRTSRKDSNGGSSGSSGDGRGLFRQFADRMVFTLVVIAVLWIAWWVWYG